MLLLAPFATFCPTISALLLATTTCQSDPLHGVYRCGPVPFLGTMALCLVAYFLVYIAGRVKD